MYRKTYALVDEDIITDNVKNIIKNYPYKYYIGVVKANAYGHGDYIVNAMIRGGINYLAASSLEECLSIRKWNKDIPILCLEPIGLEYLPIAAKNNITITVSNLEYFLKINSSDILKVHLKIDSGMNRLGFKDKYEVKRVYDDIAKSPTLILEGIYTHFATSGIWDDRWDKQVECFKELTSLIDLSEIPMVHLDRSLTLVEHPKLDFANATRLGIVMYGFAQKMKEPDGLRKVKRDLFLKNNKISDISFSNNLDVKPALKLYSEVMEIKYVKKDEYVGYGSKYRASSDIIIGIVPIGFADGFIKQNEGRYIKINGNKYQVIGEIGMDMIVIKIDKSVKVHDKVLLYDDLASDAHSMNISAYSLLTSITTRVPRVYKHNSDYKEIKY